MKILHICPRYLPAVGGAEIHMAELSQRFAAAGHEVTVATSNALDFEYLWDPSKQHIKAKSETIAGVIVKRFPVRHLPLAPTSYHAVRRGLQMGGPPFLSGIAPKLVGLDDFLRTEISKFDIVAGMNIAYEGIMAAGLRAAQAAGKPFVAYPLTHLGAGERPGDDPLGRFYTMPHQQKLVTSSNSLIAQTETEMRFYNEAGLAKDKIVIAGPGINPAAVQGGDGETWREKHGLFGIIIACICTLTPEKGIGDLIKAMDGLSDQSVTLVLAGTITEEVRPLLENIDTSRVKPLGKISDDEKRGLLSACDIFAMPSRIDSFGIAFLEAWANGKPVVGSTAWGMADVISEDEDGMLAPSGDTVMLETKLRLLLDHPAERMRLGANGYEKLMQQHTWDLKFEPVLNRYLQLAERGQL